MRSFDYSNVCFVPDTNIIYPTVFLHNVTKLPVKEATCKKCFTILKERFNIKILPENTQEFFNLIYGKFRKLLDDIRYVAKKAKRENQNKKTFERKVWDQINAYGKDYGSLILYWKMNKDFFYNWVTMDDYTRKISLYKLIDSTLQRYRNCVNGLEVSWNKTSEINCQIVFDVLKEERNQGKLPSDVDDIDLRIIAGCFEYVDKYLPYGVLYLVTGDNSAYDSVKKAVRLKSITGSEGKIRAGLDTIKPTDLLQRVQPSSS